MEHIIRQECVFIKCCTGALNDFIQNQLIEKTEIIKKQLKRYIDDRRDIFGRFFFLSDKQLCRLLCLQYTDQSIDFTKKSIQCQMALIFENAENFEYTGPKEYTISGIVSNEGEVLSLPKQFLGKVFIEQWMKQQVESMQKQLKLQMVQCFKESVSLFRDCMTETLEIKLNGDTLDKYYAKYNTQIIQIVKQCIMVYYI